LSNRIDGTHKSKIGSSLTEIVLNDLKTLFLNLNIHKKKSFLKWQETYQAAYGPQHTNVKLYIIQALLYFIGYYFFVKYVLKSNSKNKNNNDNLLKAVQEVQNALNNEWNFTLFNFEYFDSLLECISDGKLKLFATVLYKLKNSVFSLKVEPYYKFDFLIQNILSPVIRHKIGEFYTMPFLAKKMVNEVYKFGDKIIDPCCGTGNFLIEIIKKILSSNKPKFQKIIAINNIYGCDINPISILITKLNFLLLLKDYASEVKLNLFIIDSLFPEEQKNKNLLSIENLHNTFDLVIGNPPWYTLRDINSLDYQIRVKKLSENLNIKPLPKNVLNIEIAALFFYQAKDFLKVNGKIMLVLTKGLITGSHASRFRNFRGFKNVKVWIPEKRLEKMFHVDFICLLAQKSENISQLSNKKIDAFNLTLKNEKGDLGYFDDVNLNLKRTHPLIPYFIELKDKKTYTKKLISQELKEKLLPYGESPYKKLFHKGADLNPRNLIFVEYVNVNDDLVKIKPDKRIFKKAKAPWNKIEFDADIVENKYLFKVIKSTELVKFYIYDYYNVFLPLSKTNLSFNYDDLSKNAKKFYNKINQIYLKYKKSTTKNKSLIENINRWSKLINNRQLSKIKVVYNNSGSLINSSVVIGDYLVTGDLSFYDTQNIDEAHYICAILNSSLMTNQIKIKKSSRHIFKIPFEVPIKKFNENNKNHRSLADLGKQCQSIAENTVTKMISKSSTPISKIKIQKFLDPALSPFLRQIDEILKLEFTNLFN